MAFVIENGVLKKYIPEDGETEVVIPEGVTAIGEQAFWGCGQLSQITIPPSVRSIGYAAFAFCENLCQAILPEGVTKIDAHAFEDCSRLTHLTIPSSVTDVGDHVFYGVDELYDLTIYGVRLKCYGCLCDELGDEFYEMIRLIQSKNFAVTSVSSDVKYVAAVGLWLKTSDPDAERYITEHLDDILPFLIKNHNPEAIQKLLDSGKIIKKENIDKCIEYAIAHTQNGGSPEIQMMLMHYKSEVLGYKDSSAVFKL